MARQKRREHRPKGRIGCAKFPLGLRILLPGCRHAMDDRHTDQTENAHADPLHRHVEQIGADRQAGDQDDVSDEVNSK
jgi:hypothetical protein